MNFASDNTSGMAPEIVSALVNANSGLAASYGADAITLRLERRLSELFEHPVAAFTMVTGSAANALALASFVPPWGVIYCHRTAHINTDECGAPEFFTAGAKIAALDGDHGKLAPDAVLAAMVGQAGNVHHAQPAIVSISQASEAGTVYRPTEITTLADIAHDHGLALHMDGARFANAVATLGLSPAALTWRCGVDVLSLGATKNGALAAEAVIFFRPEQARDFAYRRKRAGHLLSKMRYVSAQLEAYFSDGLWLRLARQANDMAARLARGLAGLPGCSLLHPVEANEIFLALPPSLIDALLAAGFVFYRWPAPQPAIRLVTSFDTVSRDVDLLIATARKLTAAAAGPAGHADHD